MQGFLLLIFDKIYTIIKYNEGPPQLQSCVYKKNKGTIQCINLSNYFNLKQGWDQQVEKKNIEAEVYIAFYGGQWWSMEQ